MYTAYKTYTIKCAAGSSGPDVTQGASAESVITQRDADVKAYGLAQRLAYEFLVCTLDPTPATPIFCSDPVTKTASAQAGYEPHVFSVTLGPCAIYSTVSKADANAAAAIAAQVEANHERDIGQKRIYYNTDQTFSNSCTAVMGPMFDPAVITATVTAGTWSSYTSQADADFLAYQSVKSIVFSLAHQQCVPFWFSTRQSTTATCTLPLVGQAVTVTNPAGFYKSYISQADANAQSLAAAHTAAAALISCFAGFYNTPQSYTANCVDIFGSNWVGTSVTITIPAGAYSDTTLAAANAQALAAATIAAVSALYCTWGGGLEP